MVSTRTSPVTCTAPRILASSRGPNNAVSIGRKYIRACQISGGVPRMLLKAITPLCLCAYLLLDHTALPYRKLKLPSFGIPCTFPFLLIGSLASGHLEFSSCTAWETIHFVFHTSPSLTGRGDVNVTKPEHVVASVVSACNYASTSHQGPSLVHRLWIIPFRGIPPMRSK